jgi:membrane protein YqaA with SNARE-associated domain
MMARFGLWLEGFVMAIGGPGLFVIAFLDSSFLSFPEINDFLIIWMVTQHKERMVYYATMATLGSIAGCLALYFVGRKGGDALLRRRFRGDRLDRASALMRRHGALALLVPALLPPPAPFKIFVLMGGVAQIPLKTFVSAIGIGRGARYFGEGVLAVFWGDAAIQYLQENGRNVAIFLAVAVLVGGIAYALRHRVRTRHL